VGAAVAVAASRDPGLRFEDGCTSVVVYRATKARAGIEAFAADARYQSPVAALDAWLLSVQSDAEQCFGLGENMLPPPAPGASVPNLPSAAVAAVYLLYLDYMADTFAAVRPGFDAGPTSSLWGAIADRYGLSTLDVNAVPVEWLGD
jgi:hypothetical protein